MNFVQEEVIKVCQAVLDGLYLGALYMRSGRDKKQDGMIFVSPLYEDFFNRDRITTQMG